MNPPAAENASLGVPPLPAYGLASWVPGLWVLRHYRWAWIGRDLVAGVVVSALLVPAGRGYAEASGLPAVSGLYATIAGLLAYAVFGPSRILVLGPDSALSAMIAAAVVGKAAGDPARAVALGSMLAVLTGLFCVAAGLSKAGFLTELLSKPVRVGYLNGIAFTIVVTQLPKLFGFSVRASDVVHGAAGFGRGVWAGQTRPEALGIGLVCVAVILLGRQLLPRIPGVLVAVVGATVTVAWTAWPVAVVGAVPRGLPWPTIPAVGLEDLGDLVSAAAGIALVAFADTSVLSRALAARARQRVDPNREVIGLGIANVVSGLFLGFPTSSSSSRTPVAEAAGSRTQLTGVVAAAVITGLLVGAPGLLHDLPITALAAVVLTAAWRVFDFTALRTFYRVRLADFALALVATVGVVALGVLPGIAVAIGLSLLDVVRRAWRPHDAVLGRVGGLKGYHDLKRYPAARQVPGLVLFRWDAPLFFANAESFFERVLEVVAEAPSPPRWVVVAAEPITDVDTTAAEAIEALTDELRVRGVRLVFAELKDPVRDRLIGYGVVGQLGPDAFFPTLGVAVKAYLSGDEAARAAWEAGDDG